MSEEQVQKKPNKFIGDEDEALAIIKLNSRSTEEEQSEPESERTKHIKSLREKYKHK